MPRGVRKVSAAPAAQGPAPMVLIEPAADGAIRLNAYGLDGGEIVDLLRRSLLHVVAMQAGVEVISVEVPAHGAVVASRPAPSKVKALKPSVNGRQYERRKVALADEFDEADE